MASQEWELLCMNTKKLSTIKFSRLFSDRDSLFRVVLLVGLGKKSHLEDKVLGICKNPMYIWLDFMNFAAHAGNDSVGIIIT